MPIRVGSSYNNGNGMDRRVSYPVFLNKIIERAFVIVMGEFHVWYIKWNRIQFVSLRFDVDKWNIKDFGLRINETLDEPRTGYPVNLGSFPCDPFHTF